MLTPPVAGGPLISFDIDGTLESGDPPGPVLLDVVRLALAAGIPVGSCSDQTVTEQRGMWTRAGIEVSFAAPKIGLPTVRADFAASAYVHVGDTETDERYARLAGFHFVPVLDLPRSVGPDRVLSAIVDAVSRDRGLVG